MSLEHEVERDATRGDWLERIARLAYEADVQNDMAFASELEILLAGWERMWGIRAVRPFE